MAVTPQKIQKKLLIRQGDNWFNLAQRFGVSPTQLAQANGDIKRLLPGQNIVIPTANAALKGLIGKRKTGAPLDTSPVPAGIPSDVWRRMQQDPAYQGQNAPGGKLSGVSVLGTYGQKPLFQQPSLPDVPSLQYGPPPPGIPSDVWRQMQNNPQQGMQQIAKPNAAMLLKPAAQANTGASPVPGAYQPAPAGQATTPAASTTAPKSAAAQQVLANIAAAKASGKAFSITDQERVAAEWKILNPGQPVPTFSQGFLQRLANADNAADYQRILQNWSASAGGVGAKNLVDILNKAYNDPTYPWPKAIMPYELAKYNIDKSLLDQLYVYDPQLGYYVIRTNVQGNGGAGAGTGGGGGGGAPQTQAGFTGSGGMGNQSNRGYSQNQNMQSGQLGLINWRF